MPSLAVSGAGSFTFNLVTGFSGIVSTGASFPITSNGQVIVTTGFDKPVVLTIGVSGLVGYFAA